MEFSWRDELMYKNHPTQEMVKCIYDNGLDEKMGTCDTTL